MKASELRDIMATAVLVHNDPDVTIYVDEWPEKQDIEDVTWVDVDDGILRIGYHDKPKPAPTYQEEQEASLERSKEQQRRMEEQNPQYEGLWPWS